MANPQGVMRITGNYDLHELFERHTVDDKMAFKTHHGKWIHAHVNRSVNGNGITPGPSEQFHIVKAGTISLGKFVMKYVTPSHS